MNFLLILNDCYDDTEPLTLKDTTSLFGIYDILRSGLKKLYRKNSTYVFMELYISFPSDIYIEDIIGKSFLPYLHTSNLDGYSHVFRFKYSLTFPFLRSGHIKII